MTATNEERLPDGLPDPREAIEWEVRPLGPYLTFSIKGRSTATNFPLTLGQAKAIQRAFAVEIAKMEQGRAQTRRERRAKAQRGPP